MKHPLISLVWGLLLASQIANAQCMIPPGAVLLETGPGSTIDFATVSSVNKVYYVPSGTTVTVNHSGALTIANTGTILVLDGATFNLSMGASNMTINGGTIQLCSRAKMNINPGHDFTMQNNSTMQLASFSHLNMCNFGHDITFNGGDLNMDDYSSFEISDYHRFTISSANIVKYIGAGTVGVATGNPIVHTTGDDFITYSNTNAMSSNLTASNHIDFVDDGNGGDKPGGSNYCGPLATTNHLLCRSPWNLMNFTCGSAANYLDLFVFLPLKLTRFSCDPSGKEFNFSWTLMNDNTLDHFDLEELSGNNAVFVGRVEGLNNGTSVQNYSYSVSKITGDHYYRLKMVNKKGQGAYSTVLKVNYNENTYTAAYNPSGKKLILKAPPGFPFKVQLYNLNGNMLFEKTLSGSGSPAEIEMGNIPTAVYVVKMYNQGYSKNIRLMMGY